MPCPPQDLCCTRNADCHALHTLIDRLQQAWNAGCGDELATFFCQDVDYTAWNGIYLHGRTAVVQNCRRIFGAHYLDGRLCLHVINIRFLADHIAAAHVGARLCLDDERLPPLLEYAMLFILARRPSQWRCEVLHNTLVQSGRHASLTTDA